MQTVTKNLLKLHLVVFIYGFTAILGKLITLDAIQLVWYRMLIAFLALGILLQIRGRKLSVDHNTLVQLIGIGFVVAFHWITFFHAIKISTISVALAVWPQRPSLQVYWSPPWCADHLYGWKSLQVSSSSWAYI
ncbi:EamA family transporter [Marinilabilia salmonicolor]|uniref:EamA family transporter n=1 Tax=Marinilabilia salmonicolor TaxID=989 RepID=UPI001F40C4D5|nr:EamA family transporter [Marinilabilia salmonicolor]